MSKVTYNGRTYNTSDRNSGESKREYISRMTGMSKSQADDLIKNGGTQQIENSGKGIREDAREYLEKLSPEAVDFILSSDFGDNLNKNEAEKLNSKYINASQANSATKEDLLYSNLPDEAFEAKPQLIPGTPEYQAAMDKLSTAYFDVLQQQLNAGTEQEQAAAEYNWQTLKNSMEKTLNVNLSNDAFQAWGQVQGLKSQYANQNISNSGLQNETMDNYLKNVRNKDMAMRDESASKSDSSKMEYYRKFATPEQINELVISDPIKAKSWGLIPSDEIRNAMTPKALKKKNPTMSDQDIERQIASVLDSNGNYRSSLYQKYMTGSNLGINIGNLANQAKDEYGNVIAQTYTPSDSGYLDIEATKQQYLDANTPLADQLKDYNERVELGQTKPTKGEQSGTASGTQFNKINPGNVDGVTIEDIQDTKYKPGSMLSSAS